MANDPCFTMTGATPKCGKKTLRLDYADRRALVDLLGASDPQVTRGHTANGTDVNTGALKRLVSCDMVRWFKVPSAWAMGGDVLGMHVTRAPLIHGTDPLILCRWRSLPFTLMNTMDRDTLLCLSVHPSYTRLSMALSTWKRELAGQRFDYTVMSTEMPCSDLYFHDLFSFEGIAARELGVEPPSVESGLHDIQHKAERAKLNSTQVRLMRGLLDHPAIPSSALSDTLGINRQSIARYRSQFMREGLLRRIAVPNLDMLGIGVLGAFQFELALCEPDIIRERLRGLSREFRPFSFLNVSSFSSQFMLTLHGDFGGFQRDVREVLKRYDEEGILRAPPFISVMTIPEMFWPDRCSLSDDFFRY